MNNDHEHIRQVEDLIDKIYARQMALTNLVSVKGPTRESIWLKYRGENAQTLEDAEEEIARLDYFIEKLSAQ